MATRLEQLRVVALAEPIQLKERAVPHVLVAAGHATRLVLRQQGMSEPEGRLQVVG
ncbi:hypothetical protein [Geminicoccus harenae]|uniref:hypothetical protein n=1 Tax=Geminicoccus harenae TaxID=2498453 RepID=UPI001C940123|nr:hypothetical protein [Geminicoccus harenae]